MKPYFTKYLPVEREIKKDDFLLQDSLGITQCLTNNEGQKLMEQGFKKHKLFLCSRDIKVGDKVWMDVSNSSNYTNYGYQGIVKYIREDGYFQIKEDGVYWDSSIHFSQLGEISLDATWVKEGDEFDEDEIKRTVSVREWDGELEGWDYVNRYPKGNEVCPLYQGEEISKEYPIEIKGPCGHFH